MRKYEVYEDNAGGITMFVWDEKGENIVWAHSGYEYVGPQLLDDIKALKNGDGPEEDWDGNGITTGLGFTSWEDAGLELSSVYDEAADENSLIADNDGVYPELMGRAGERIFGIIPE